MSCPNDIRVLDSLLREQSTWASVCTEPAMVALAAAHASRALGEHPQRIEVYLSSGVLKNALSAGLPNTHEKGPELAAALGALSRNPELGLTILSASAEDLSTACQMVKSGRTTVRWARDKQGVYCRCVVRGSTHTAEAVIQDSHTNVTQVLLDGNQLMSKPAEEQSSGLAVLRDWSMQRLLDAATALSPLEYEWLLHGARSCLDLADHPRDPGAETSATGQTISPSWFCSSTGCETPIVEVVNRVSRAISARMSGVAWPVVTSGGSGNQGIMVSVPVMSVAEHLQLDEAQTIKALTIAHSVNLFVKAYMGEVSCSCGGVSAAAGLAAATCWMRGGTVAQIEEAVSQVLASLFGMICDGAKVTCALKGTASVLTGMLTGLGASRCNGSIRDQGVLGKTLDETLTRIAALNDRVINKADELMLDLMRPQAGTGTE